MTHNLDFTQRPVDPLGDLDTKIFRNELEQSCAHCDEDLLHEMTCCLSELPMLNLLNSQDLPPDTRSAMLMCIAWEAGRRYAFIEACATLDTAIAGLGGAVDIALGIRLGVKTPEQLAQVAATALAPDPRILDDASEPPPTAPICAARPPRKR